MDCAAALSSVQPLDPLPRAFVLVVRGLHVVQDTEARKAALDKEHNALRAQHTKQAQHLAELAGKSKTLEAEVSGAQKQRSQMIDALKRLNVLVSSPIVSVNSKITVQAHFQSPEQAIPHVIPLWQSESCPPGR